MILDRLENLNDYVLGENFDCAYEFLKNNDLMSLPACKLRIKGDDVIVNIQDFKGKELAACRMEAHKEYADIQIVLGKGKEQMGWKPQVDCNEILTPYNEEKDVEFYKDKADTYLTVRGGQFVIFFPDDAHQPGIAPGQEYRKLLVKVRV